MASEHAIRRYRYWYAHLLRFHSKQTYARFGEEMEHTFQDCLRDRAKEERGLLSCALWMFVDTSAGIIQEHVAMHSPRIVRIALVTAGILLVPFVAMQFTDEVDWDVFDFAVMGSLAFGVGLAYELMARTSGNTVYRSAFGVGLAGAFLLIWVNGAVGIIGDGPVNAMYLGVVAVLVIGASVARLEPQGMARALLATAVAQMLVPAIALTIWPPPVISWSPNVIGVFVLSGFFATLFVVSALLFRRASVLATSRV